MNSSIVEPSFIIDSIITITMKHIIIRFTSIISGIISHVKRRGHLVEQSRSLESNAEVTETGRELQQWEDGGDRGRWRRGGGAVLRAGLQSPKGGGSDRNRNVIETIEAETFT